LWVCARADYAKEANVSRLDILPIVLPKPLYEELERRALAQERDPLQQARWMLKRALEVSDQNNAAGRQPADAVTA
jgi:hypothetical protein